MAEVAETKQPSAEELDAAQLQKDVEGFNAELIPLLGKYNVGLGATAFITPDGRIGGRPTLFRAPAPEKKAEAGGTAPAALSETATAPAPAKPLESSEA